MNNRCVSLAVLWVLVAAGCSRSTSPARAGQPASFDLYFVTLNPAHPPGEPIGCGDVLVHERQAITKDATPRSPLERAVRAQLTAKPPAGAINRVADLHIALRSISTHDGQATVVLEPFSMGGECDAPRVAAQLTRLVEQFKAFDRVNLMVGDRTLAQYLSLR